MMLLRFALFALAFGQWGCGNDGDPAPTAAGPVEAVLRPTGVLQPWDLSSIVPIESVSTMPSGTRTFLRTEFANGELADLEMTFIQVVDDFLPPMPVYMFEASDPVLIQLGGIARGMSGSPIFTKQGTWGAIAYGFTGQDNPPYYFFATPIEWIIGTRETIPAAKPTATWEGHRITPLETPLLSTGLNPLLAGNSSILSGTISAGLTKERQVSFEAGRPLAVGLLLGELTLGSFGTVSYVDGKHIYGYGHPMFGTGPVELPIIEARVLGEISHWHAPFKFATLNPTVRGILTEDRLPAVRGVLDENPALIPLKSVYTFPAGGTAELDHQLAISIDPQIALNLVAAALVYPLWNRIENYPDYSVRVATDISFVGSDSTLARSRLYSESQRGLYSLVDAAVCELSHVLEQLMIRRDNALQLRAAEARIELIPEPRFATITAIAADSYVTQGNTLSITTSLYVGGMREQDIELAFNIPETLPAGRYQLKVGSAAELAGVSEEEECRDDEPFGFFSPSDDSENDKPLDEVFARANKPDEHTILEARLAGFSPATAGTVITMQKDIDLLLEGVHTFKLEVERNDI